MLKLRHFGKKHGILAKSRDSRHLTKITASVFPWISTVPNYLSIGVISYFTDISNAEEWASAMLSYLWQTFDRWCTSTWNTDRMSNEADLCLAVLLCDIDCIPDSHLYIAIQSLCYYNRLLRVIHEFHVTTTILSFTLGPCHGCSTQTKFMEVIFYSYISKKQITHAGG